MADQMTQDQARKLGERLAREGKKIGDAVKDQPANIQNLVQTAYDDAKNKR